MNKHIDRRDFFRTVSAGGAAVAGMDFVSWLAAAEQVGRDYPRTEQLGWQLACAAYSFVKLTFCETIDKVASLGLKGVVSFNGQRLNPRNADAKTNEWMSMSDRQDTKKKLRDAGVKLVCHYCNPVVSEDACRRLFEFVRDMGIETLVGEPPIEAFDLLDKLCEEYQINLAVHNHPKPSQYWNPETVFNVCQGRSQRIGACCDTGHWVRSGVQPVEALVKLQGRILALDLKDVDEQGAWVPFGKGNGKIHGMLKELHRQHFRGVFSIEYDGQHPPGFEDEIAQSAAYFNNVAKELAAN